MHYNIKFELVTDQGNITGETSMTQDVKMGKEQKSTIKNMLKSMGKEAGLKVKKVILIKIRETKKFKEVNCKTDNGIKMSFRSEC